MPSRAAIGKEDAKIIEFGQRFIQLSIELDLDSTQVVIAMVALVSTFFDVAMKTEEEIDRGIDGFYEALKHEAAKRPARIQRIH